MTEDQEIGDHCERPTRFGKPCRNAAQYRWGTGKSPCRQHITEGEKPAALERHRIYFAGFGDGFAQGKASRDLEVEDKLSNIRSHVLDAMRALARI